MKKLSISIFITLLTSFLLAASVSAQKQYEIHVSAGAFDRLNSVVSFNFPEEVPPGRYTLNSRSGKPVILQVDESSRGWFILNQLDAGQSQRYLFSEESVSPESGVYWYTDSTQITFLYEGREILSYYHGDNNPPDELDDRYKRGGYIHPVYSPDGVKLTNHLNVDGHPHHSGIWSAWTKTEFEGRNPDFWNVHLNTGRVDQADSLLASWKGPVHAGFRSIHFFKDLSAPEPVVALNEQWKVNVYRPPHDKSYYFFDLVITQTANTGKPLILPEYRYGGVAFRGHEDWDNPDNLTFMTAESLGRDGHGTRTKWTHIGGYSDGDLAGITIMSHPDNFRHPQTVRIHPDSPFFNYAPTQLGEMKIEPGIPYEVRYRFVTYDGEPDPDELNRLWNDFAYPPGVSIKEK